MIRIKEAIVVEGKYDKIRLDSVVDALVIETNGFGIFKDRSLINLLRLLGSKRGLIILTDSDSAGFVIRNHLNGIIPHHQIKHAYVPPIQGRERRKTKSSKEGLLGVEGIDGQIIEEALRRAGATFENETKDEKSDSPPITKMDLYESGLSGGFQSSLRRHQLLGLLNLPEIMSTNKLVDVLNATMTRNQYEQTMRDLGWMD